MNAARSHMRCRASGILLALALALAGCAGMATPTVDEIEVPAQYGLGDSEKNQPVEALCVDGKAACAHAVDGESDATHPAIDPNDQRWWQAFGDPGLDRFVAKAVAVNTDLVAAGLRLQRARLVAGLAANQLLPQFDGSVSSGASRALDGDAETQRSAGARVSVSYEIDLWGRLRNQREVAVWELQATAQDRDSTALALLAESCNRYWSLAFLNQRIAEGDASLARVERTVKLVQAQFDAGAVSRVELREAEQNLYSQRAAQSQLRQQRVETRNAITVLMDGQPWPEVAEPQDLEAAHSPALEPGLPAHLLGRRPDLRAAELRLRGSLAGIAIARYGYYPAITLNAALGTSSTALTDILKNPVLSLGAGLALPFLRWREMQLNTALAGRDYELAANAFRKLLYTALSEVDNALSARAELAAQVAASRESLAAAADVERLYEVRYRAGAATLRVWLDAQQTRRNAELALAQVRLNQLTNDATLFLALGGAP